MDWLYVDYNRQWETQGKGSGVSYRQWIEEKYERDSAEHQRARLQEREKKKLMGGKRAGDYGQ